jgi:hypothetical protein
MKKDDLKKLAIIPLTLLGAYLYRLRGGGPGPNLPRPLDQLLFSAFPCILLPGLSRLEGAIEPGFIWWPWLLGWVICSLIAVAVECTGHGGFMDLGTNPKEPGAGRTKERLEFLIYPLYDKLPRYWYDALGLALTGFAVTLLPGIYVAVAGHVLAGVLLALSGLLKTPGYMLGRWVFGNTEAGEWISGGLRWFAAGLIYAFLM